MKRFSFLMVLLAFLFISLWWLFHETQALCNKTGLSSFARMHCHMQIGSHLMSLPVMPIANAISLCDKLATIKKESNLAHHCYDGAFSAYFKKDAIKQSLVDFCRQFQINQPDNRKYGACINSGWILFAEETKTPQGIRGFCALSPTEPSHGNCLDILVGRAAAAIGVDSKLASAFCNELEKKDEGVCFADLAITAILAGSMQTKEAIALCGYASTPAKQLCLGILSRAATDMFPKDDPRSILQP